MSALRPTSLGELQDAVRSHHQVLPHGAQTKPAMCASDDATRPIDVTGLTGVIDYEPSEFTFTAWAGTPLSEITAMLTEQGQYLPCDPPLIAQGSTLGGLVASGLSGPGRLRYGGLRDFVIGVKHIDGEGRFIATGGKVVKNAAGFDLPKLFCGSRGRLGVMAVLTFKVFPDAEQRATLVHDAADLASAVATMHSLYRSPLEPEAIEIEPSGRCLIRLAGRASAMPGRSERVLSLIGGGQQLTHTEADAYWSEINGLWHDAPEPLLCRVPMRSSQVHSLDAALEPLGPSRHYSAMGNTAWVRLPNVALIDELQTILAGLGLPGVVLRGEVVSVQLNARPGITTRIRKALDPVQRFPEYT